jgi:hypothetical protein
MRQLKTTAMIAREMHKAEAGIRSLAEPFLDTTSDWVSTFFGGVRKCFPQARAFELQSCLGNDGELRHLSEREFFH